MSIVDGAKSLQSTSDESVLKSCDPCKYGGIEVEATKYCDDCKESLCRTCTESHKRFKMSRNHKLLSVQHIPSHTGKDHIACSVLCECCQTLEVTDYCEDHHAVVCQHCTSVKHRKCKIELIKDKSSTYNKVTFDFVADRASAIKSKADKQLEDRKADLSNLESAKEICTKQIEAFRRELNAFLDRLEQDIRKDLNKRMIQTRQDIERHISTYSTIQQLLQSDFELIENAKKSCLAECMFASEIKISNRQREYEILLQDIDLETKTPIISFTGNQQLIDMQMKLNNFGDLTVDYIRSTSIKSFPELKVISVGHVDIKLPVDLQTPWISGCQVVSDDKVVLCDFKNKRVKLLKNSFTIQDSLDVKDQPWDVSVINSNNAVITLPKSMQLQYIDLIPKLKTGRTIQLDKKCWGIQVAREEIFVTLSNDPGEGELRILDIDGNLKKRIGANQDGSFIFKTPCYVTVGASSKIYVSDMYTNTITCLMPNGSIVYQYKDQDLKRTKGIYVDIEDNIAVCGENSHNVQIVTAYGKNLKTLLTSKNDLNAPCSVTYRHRDTTFFVGVFNQTTLMSYKLE